MRKLNVTKAKIIDYDLDKNGNLWFLVRIIFDDNKGRSKWLTDSELKLFLSKWQFEIPISMGL